MSASKDFVVAYLVNIYPKVSHSFIRREIAALEAHGIAVERFSIRTPDELVDEADHAEAARTHFILAQGVLGLSRAILQVFFRKPVTWLRTVIFMLNIGFDSDRGLFRHMIYFAEACLLACKLAQLKVTHLHAHFGTNPADVAMYVASLTGLPYSFTVHGPEEFDRPVALRLEQKINRAQFVVAVSSYGRSQLFRWIDHSEWSKVQVVHCGLDAAFLNNDIQAVAEAPRFVCVGRLCEQKGQLLLVQAVAKLVQQGYQFELILVGDGELRQPIEKLIKQYDLENTVTITGWQTNQQVHDWLLSARVAILASFAEGLPVAIMEALALGRPVISTYIAGIPELVTQDCGWLIPAGSVTELVTAMTEALKCSSDELTAMGHVGAQRVQERHDVTIEADKLARHFVSKLGITQT